MIRRSTNIQTRYSDWNPDGNYGRGELLPSFGSNYRQYNGILQSRLSKSDCSLAEYQNLHPGEISVEIIRAVLDNRPILRKDRGIGFVDFTIGRIESDYLRNRIGMSRYKNSICCLHVFSSFVQKFWFDKVGHDLYIGDISPELIEKYILWRRSEKGNCDATINHALTPILKGCQYAAECGMLASDVNARIQNMKILTKTSIFDDSSSTDVRGLSECEMSSLIEYYHNCKDIRRKQYIEIFLFSYHACGVRIIDIITLRWSHVDFEKKELRKVLVKTGKRHTIPLSDDAISILEKWKDVSGGSKYVFKLVPETIDLKDDALLYRIRNNVTKCIDQSLAVAGRQIGIPVKLTMHVARHTFAVHALNNGMAMSVVSRLLGHSSTSITERVYAKYLPETLASELDKIKGSMSRFSV